jgi:transcriptional regulator with XRE-family HTH domain
MDRLQHSSFGTRLKELRQAQGLSIRHLAARCGLSKSSIASYERGEVTPGLEASERIAAGLGIGLAQLLGSIDGIEECGAAGGMVRRRVMAGEGMLAI